MRIEEVLFDKQANVSESTLFLLASKLKKRILLHYPEMCFRIGTSSKSSTRITGTRNSNIYGREMEFIQNIREDGKWLPN
ncbi:DinI-like family protein [Xenorhabdus szentirmaii]|uniref:DinI-like family protein n=1 Tax=Xenorhabdus szentirmaii TaxID=290112 RepID=A0AAW3YVM6_9GAMM|nr:MULTISPECIES: DinI-like family protein [Xenorhabdus]MBD2779868.1 DinI-like family protein [Xenorhabdus sp. 38]MBD2800233.1 DinI-like family protein [Xenorhabdus sp. M]PHM30855.1 DNA damage-inducible protein [Xenorhabdus szentirmaii DSM 16338]PHM40400.1 DNA damage-inducible protein [Xenorhabdus szentirmaii]